MRRLSILAALVVACSSGGSTAPTAGSAVVAATPDPPLPGVAAPSEAIAAELRAVVAAKGPAYRPHTRNLAPDGSPLYTNRLVREASPYLLQHAHNPMNWYAWGDEPFARAEREHKLVLVSVGYATCHWCHVMEDDSFEDPEVAAYVNASFICIKVDREERPDVDAIYMDAVQAMVGDGGWPLNVVVDAKRRPVFGATFLRKAKLLSVLQQLRAADPAQLAQVAEQVEAAVAGANAHGAGGGMLGAEAVERGVRSLARRFDKDAGGFGARMKFPSEPDLELVLRYARRTGDPQALAIVVQTLRAMAAGGIHDQLGGGFHRYATDRAWLVPHFEKMLYDNAQLAAIYSEAAQLLESGPAPDPATAAAFSTIAASTLAYLERDMQAPDGGFYGASDADSPISTDERAGRAEGRFFTWTADEIAAVLPPADATFAVAYFHVDDPAARVDGGRGILHLAPPPAPIPNSRPTGSSARTATSSSSSSTANPRSTATPRSTANSSSDSLSSSTANRSATNVDVKVVDPAQVERVIAALFAVRAKRPPPARDDKVIASWNGLAISAFARVGFARTDAHLVAVAQRTAALVLAKLRDGTGLARSWRDGRASGVATLTDYASVIAGLLDLFAVDADPRWLAAARDLAAQLEPRFADPAGGAYFMTDAAREPLLVRIAPLDDTAEPSANAVVALDLLRLAELTGDDTFRTRAERIFGAASATLAQAGGAAGLRTALEAYLDATFEIAIISPAAPDPLTAALLAEVRRAYLPTATIVALPESDLAARTAELPFLDGKQALDHRPTAFVCIRTTCREPTHDPHALATQIARVSPLYTDRSPSPL